MYAVEGKLVTRKSPEAYLGQFGIFHESVEHDFNGTTTDVFWATGNERIVKLIAKRMLKNGRIPVYATVEKITSLEQAQKYARPSKESVRITRYHEPDLPELLDAQVPQDAKLLEGAAQLWQEQRIPIPYIYFSANGKLLADVEYDPTRGWHDRVEYPERIEGTRTVRGILTPIARISTTDTTLTKYRRY